MAEPFSLLPSLADGEVVAVRSRKLASIPHLQAFFGAEVSTSLIAPRQLGAIAAWGMEGAALRARTLAKRAQVPFIAVREGLFHGLDHRHKYIQPYSLVLDASGIFYDATRPSDLETMLEQGGWESPELLAEADQAMDAVLSSRLSRFNHAPDASPYLLTTPGLRTRILVLDQAVDDPGVRLGMADSGAFLRMLEQARQDHPGAALFLRTPPAVLQGRKRGYLAHNPAVRGVTLIEQDWSAHSLLAQADEVYTVNAQMGFEALMLGKKVHCFGVPFYAGWGLTTDSIRSARRTRRRTVRELFAAACMLYSRYVNPITGEACSIHDTIRLLVEQRRMNERNSRLTCCVGFSRYEFATLRHFLHSTRAEAEREKNVDEAIRRAAKSEGRVAASYPHVDSHLVQHCAKRGVELLRVQAGFFPGDYGRKGMFPSPQALNLDSKGFADDPSQPCALEHILEHSVFSPDLLTRAKGIMEWMLAQGWCLGSEFAGIRRQRDGAKVNISALPLQTDEQRIVLIPGQDESSPAWKLGGQELTCNASLLTEVRKLRPHDFLVYLQPSRLKNSLSVQILAQVDLVLSNVSPVDILPRVHEVHTLSSLVGLDALIHRIPVHTYGAPFYAGWGLTQDSAVFARRSRPLSVEALVAGALILYASYYDAHTRLFCGPEEIMRLRQLPPRSSLPLAERLRRNWEELRVRFL